MFDRVLIREATEADMDGILEIEREAIAPPWSHGALLGEIYREETFFAVACPAGIDGTVGAGTLGFIILRKIGSEGELLQIAVDKAARRMGVGDALMAAGLGHADGNSVEAVHLEVRRSNEAAAALYEKHGFLAMRVRKGYYSDPVEDAMVMVRTL